MEEVTLREYFANPPQGLDEWLEQKRGKVSASKISIVINGVSTVGSQTYLEGLAAEQLGIYDADPYQSPAMIDGSVNELAALQTYMLSTQNEVLYGSKIFIPLGEHAGVSPDAIELGENRIYLEVKCPSAPNKLARLWRTKDIKKDRADIYWQCVMNMLVLNCQSAKVIVFHPTWGIKVKDIKRDETDIDKCAKAIQAAVEVKLEIVNELSNTL